MSNHYGVNPLQARIASLAVKGETGIKGLTKMANAIAISGVGKAPINRAQRRFEERQKARKT